MRELDSGDQRKLAHEEGDPRKGHKSDRRRVRLLHEHHGVPAQQRDEHERVPDDDELLVVLDAAEITADVQVGRERPGGDDVTQDEWRDGDDHAGHRGQLWVHREPHATQEEVPPGHHDVFEPPIEMARGRHVETRATMLYAVHGVHDWTRASLPRALLGVIGGMLIPPLPDEQVSDTGMTMRVGDRDGAE